MSTAVRPTATAARVSPLAGGLPPCAAAAAGAADAHRGGGGLLVRRALPPAGAARSMRSSLRLWLLHRRARPQHAPARPQPVPSRQSSAAAGWDVEPAWRPAFDVPTIPRKDVSAEHQHANTLKTLQRFHDIEHMSALACVGVGQFVRLYVRRLKAVYPHDSQTIWELLDERLKRQQCFREHAILGVSHEQCP